MEVQLYLLMSFERLENLSPPNQIRPNLYALRRMTLTALKNQPWLNPRKRKSKKRTLLKSRWDSKWLRQMHVDKEWPKTTKIEPQRYHRHSRKQSKARLLLISFPRHKCSWMKSRMMLSKWMRWSSTQKLSPLETSSLKRTRDLKQNGLKSRKNSIWWWK